MHRPFKLNSVQREVSRPFEFQNRWQLFRNLIFLAYWCGQASEPLTFGLESRSQGICCVGWHLFGAAGSGPNMFGTALS